MATLLAGSILGAGFLSGQEILQFFGVFGSYGLVGMVLAVAAFASMSLLIVRIARLSGHREFEKVIIHKDIKWLRGLLGGIFLFFLFDVMVAMIAGAGALLEQVFGLPTPVGCALITLLVMGVALAGMAGLLTSFKLVVPLLLLSAVVVCVTAFATLPPAPIEPKPFDGSNPLLGNWFFSWLSYLSYNMMGNITLMVPLADQMEEPKKIHRGFFLGGLLLLSIFVFILIPMICYAPLVGEASLPMLALAYRVSDVLGVIYAVLLFSGMFTACLGSLYPLIARLKLLRPNLSLKRTIPILCAAAYAGSLLGFKNMVAVVYPICGYIGFIALAGILIHGWTLRKAPQ